MGVTQDFKGFYTEAKRRQNHLHQELPYRYFDDATNVFHNKKSFGIGFKLNVLGGANDDLVNSLNKFIMELPQGSRWDYQIALFGTTQTGHLLEANCELLSKRGGIVAKLAKNQTMYAKYASKNGFFHRQKNHFDLRDYGAYFFVSTSVKDVQTIIDARESMVTSLTQIGFHLEPMTPSGLIEYVEDVVNFDAKKDRPLGATYNALEPINSQVFSPDTEFLINRNNVSIRHTSRHTNEDVKTRVVSLGLRRLPVEFRLYGFPECLSSLRSVSRSIQCPHLVTLSFRVEDTGTQQQENDSKIGSLRKLVQSPMRVFMPTAADELQERVELQRSLSNKEICITSMVFNISLFTNKKSERKHVQAAKDAFAAGGLDVNPVLMLQGQAFLSNLPFMMTDGFWNDNRSAGRVRTIKSSNLVNFFPIVVDHKNFSGGMLLPTMRQQLSFLDPFNCGSDNYNIALTGGSGAGKSVFVQELAKTIFAMGGKVWILDKGGSYKKLTLMLEGTYMTPSQIYLNPFTHLDKFGVDGGKDENGEEINPLAEALDNITALYATIASPREELSQLQQSVLGDAIIAAYQKHRSLTMVDHVQEELYAYAKRESDRRINDLAVQLNKYRTDGIYGDVFNKPSMLDPDIHITTLELDGFPEAVLRPAIFALMVMINQNMYLSGSRSTPKMCIIEEAWSLLSGANAQAKTFINTGYRTARKFGGSFCTVTQGIKDFFANAEAEASYNNSDIHIVLRQGEGFSDYLQSNPDKFTQYEQHIIKNFEKSSQAGYSSAMIKAGGHTSFHRFFCDPFARACYSTEPHEYSHCESLMEQGMNVMDAIEATADKFYGDEIERFNKIVLGEETKEQL